MEEGRIKLSILSFINNFIYKIKNRNHQSEYENCITCSKQLNIKVSTSIFERKYYVQGAGQLCKSCWERIFKK